MLRILYESIKTTPYLQRSQILRLIGGSAGMPIKSSHVDSSAVFISVLKVYVFISSFKKITSIYNAFKLLSQCCQHVMWNLTSLGYENLHEILVHTRGLFPEIRGSNILFFF